MAQMALPSWFGPFAARPRLVAAFAGGALTTAVLRLAAGLEPSTAAVIGWDVLCLSYIVASCWTMGRDSPDEIRAKAARDDQGRVTILTVVLVAAVMAIVAVALELSLAKSVHGVERGLRVGLAFATVAASWFLVHLIFALHYAHGYYDRDAVRGGDVGGLEFPGGAAPSYWDFVHFAVIIGVAAQTADIAISSQRLRRLNTVHALFAFAFNTVVVALTINLLAGLFG